jgi:hypothetical protein
VHYTPWGWQSVGEAGEEKAKSVFSASRVTCQQERWALSEGDLSLVFITFIRSHVYNFSFLFSVGLK